VGTFIKTKEFSIQHEHGFLVRVFPRDIAMFLPLETSIPMLRAVRKEAKKSSSLAWHVHAYYLWMYDFLALTLWRYGQTFVAHHRGGGFTLRALPYSIYHYAVALPITLRLARIIFVQNSREKKFLETRYAINSSRILVIPNCWDGGTYRRTKQSLVPRVIHAGRMIKWKGVSEIFTICARIYKQHISLQLSMFGNGELLEEMRQIKNVPWFQVHENISRKRVLEEFANSDIFVLGTRKGEGSPQALIDAQSLGLPAVTFHILGAEDVVVDGVTGFMVQTWEEFEVKLKLLITDTDMRRTFSKNAVSRMANSYTCEVFSNRIIATYKSFFTLS
jgi:glycosyltransferase involved in cell wall biosynthesis